MQGDFAGRGPFLVDLAGHTREGLRDYAVGLAKEDGADGVGLAMAVLSTMAVGLIWVREGGDEVAPPILRQVGGLQIVRFVGHGVGGVGI